ncbi:MAG: hypothetical protein ACRDJM_11355 [Actinomycetota bacterium]
MSPRCVNGHDVDAGNWVCPSCFAPVASHREPEPEPSLPSSAETPAPDTDTPPAIPVAPSAPPPEPLPVAATTKRPASRLVLGWVALVAGLALIVGGAWMMIDRVDIAFWFDPQRGRVVDPLK